MNKRKAKKCRVCKSEFMPMNSLQFVCGISCGRQYASDKAAKEERKENRQRKEALKSRSQWMKEAQVAFNAYIRERDHGLACISCQNPPKKKNAGHYLSTGAAPELRFEEDNVHLQCEHCNSFLSGNQVRYRQNLINRIGEARVEWLEGPHKPKKYTIEQIRDMKKEYGKRARELKKSRESSE